MSRPGGQQRPLGTTRLWDPEDLDSASEVEVEEVVEVVEESSAASSSRPSLSEPVRFLRPILLKVIPSQSLLVLQNLLVK